MRVIGGILVVIIIAGVIAAFTATFTVSETQQALVLRVGEPIDAVNEPGDPDPGLHFKACLLYTSPSPRDRQKSRMPSSA